MSETSKLESYIKEHCQDIGETVLSGNSIASTTCFNAVTICRRAFRQKDVLALIPLDEEQDGEQGIAFTKDAIYEWDCSPKLQIPYADITNVDFDDDNVLIESKDGKQYSLWCGEDEEAHYSRYMYNFIADILEIVSESNGI